MNRNDTSYFYRWQLTISYKRTIFLDDPPSVIRAVKDLGDSPLFFLCWALEELGPAMFTEDAVKVGVVSVDFDDDHAARLFKRRCRVMSDTRLMSMDATVEPEEAES